MKKITNLLIIFLFLSVVSANAEKASLKAGGIHCIGCLGGLEKSVNSVDGVKNVTADVNGNVEVEYDGAKTDTAKIMKAMNDAGFPSIPAESAKES